MGTLNGGPFLPEQLKSLFEQDHTNWFLIVSDDGSSDGTLSIIEDFATTAGRKVEIRSGPKEGPPANFLSLATDTTIDADYFAWCDQDDVWLPDKLTRAIRVLAQSPPDKPALYCARTRLIDQAGVPIGWSPLFKRKPCFRNAVIQSLAGGNTMVFNRAARDLLARAPKARPISHDWWVYQLVTGAGGTVYYDRVPTVLYRQHDANYMGSNIGWRARWLRIQMLLSGRFMHWTDQNLAAFAQAEAFLTPEARQILARVRQMKADSLLSRLSAYSRSGIFRQTIAGNIALAIAILLKRV
jgi:glycosyltransferase involved in cell wall biosynthesis